MFQSIRLTPLDALLGFEKVIESTWFFSERLDPLALRRSLSTLASQHPVLCGRVGRLPGRHHSPLHGWELRRADVRRDDADLIPLRVRSEPGTSQQAAAVPDPAAFAAAVQSGGAVMAGRSPVLAASLTNYEGGGSALNVRLSHALADASGFYRLVREWSRLHSAADSGGAAPAPLELSRECVEAPVREWQGYEDGYGDGPAALDLSSWRGAALFWLLRALGPASVPTPASASTASAAGGPPGRRQYLRLTAGDVSALRAHCRAAGAARKPSANEALVASLCRVVSRQLRVPSATACSLAMVFDVRHAARLPPAYLGNAFHLLHAPPTASPWHELPLAEVCALVRALALRPLQGNALDDPCTLSGGWLAHALSLQRGRLPAPPPLPPPPPPSPSEPGRAAAAAACSLVSNYQAHLPAFAVAFGGGECLRVAPAAGDAIQMVPGPQGGVDVYLNGVAAGGHQLDGAALREAVMAGGGVVAEI